MRRTENLENVCKCNTGSFCKINVLVSFVLGTWTEYFHDDLRPFPGWGELVAVLVALYEAKNKVPDVEGSVPHPSAMVPS